jgi:hypothetical protein
MLYRVHLAMNRVPFSVVTILVKTELQHEGCVVMAVIVWLLDLQLPLQSVPITTKVVSWNPVHGEVYSIQH